MVSTAFLTELQNPPFAHKFPGLIMSSKRKSAAGESKKVEKKQRLSSTLTSNAMKSNNIQQAEASKKAPVGEKRNRQLPLTVLSGFLVSSP